MKSVTGLSYSTHMVYVSIAGSTDPIKIYAVNTTVYLALRRKRLCANMLFAYRPSVPTMYLFEFIEAFTDY